MSSTISTCFYDLLWQADAHEQLTEKDRVALREHAARARRALKSRGMKIFQRICGRPIVHRTETRQDGKKRQKTGGIRDHAAVADFLSPQSKESQ